MKTDRVDALELFGSGEHADTPSEKFREELSSDQHARFKARFRELANAMSRHPLADQLAHSIDTLRRIADDDSKH